MSPCPPTSKTPRRQLYPSMDPLDLPLWDSITSLSSVNKGGISRRPPPPIPVNNNKSTKTTRSLGGVPSQLISRGNLLPHIKPLGSYPPPSRRASCRPSPYLAHKALASLSSSCPSRSLDSFRRQDGGSFDTRFTSQSETMGTTCMPNSYRNTLIYALVKQHEAKTKLLENSTKLNGSNSKEMRPWCFYSVFFLLKTNILK